MWEWRFTYLSCLLNNSSMSIIVALFYLYKSCGCNENRNYLYTTAKAPSVAFFLHFQLLYADSFLLLHKM